jgi:hypothetical protein
MGNTVGRLQTYFVPNELDLIIGSILGDASLECRSKGIRKPKTARFRIHHCDKQKKYVFWKYSILERFVETPPKSIVSYRKWKGKEIETMSWYFHTRTSRKFGVLHEAFTQNQTENRFQIFWRMFLAKRF